MCWHWEKKKLYTFVYGQGLKIYFNLSPKNANITKFSSASCWINFTTGKMPTYKQHCFKSKWIKYVLPGCYWLAPWSRVLLEKLTVSQLVRNFPAVYEARSSIALFTRARHLSPHWATWIQPTFSHLISLRHVALLSFLLYYQSPNSTIRITKLNNLNDTKL